MALTSYNDLPTQAQTEGIIALDNARMAMQAIADYLDELEAKLHDEPRNWGTVGSIGHIDERLRELLPEE